MKNKLNIVGKIYKGIEILFGMYKKPDSLDGVKTLCARMKQDGIINQYQYVKMVKILDLENIRVKDVMIPRGNMVNIQVTSSIDSVRNLIKDSGHSRFPVMDEENKKIHGIVLTKDLLFGKNRASIKQYIRKVLFTPETRRLSSLLNDFQINHQHMAIVIDEYGDISGLITIENIIEQITGDIEDEHDLKNNEEMIEKKGDNEYHIEAQIPIYEFNEYFKTQFQDHELDTMGGLLLKKFGHIPKIGESTNLEDFTFTILKSNEKKIHKMGLKVKKPTSVKRENELL